MPTAHPQEIFGVLLIEDDPDFRLFLEHLLIQIPNCAFRIVSQAESLAEGLRLAGAETIRVVLLDLSLPDSSGLETFAHLHARAPHLPIIVLSAPEEEETALSTVHLGAQEYLIKGSINAHLLQRTLRYSLERFHAEAALARERDLLSTLLENIPDRIYFKDGASRFIRVNRAMTDLFGLRRPEEIYGKSDADFYGAEHAQEALQDELQVMRSGEPIVGKVEKEVLTTGRKSWSLTTKLPLRDHQGRIVGTCGISREITRLKEMEERLDAERNLLRSVIDNLPDLIFLKDAAGSYLLVNAAYLQWVGASDPSEILGRSVQDFYSDEEAARIQAGDQEVFLTGRPLINHEERLLDFRGGECWALMTKVPWYGDDGSILGLLCISRDITGKKIAEESLKRAYAETARSREEVLAAMAKLQGAHRELRAVQLQLIEAEKMKTVGRLAAGVAHEVKNPLAVLKMGIDYLASLPHEDEGAGVILHEMSEAVYRADSVIRGLLDFSAPTRLELLPENLNLVIEDALRYVRTEFQGPFKIIRELQRELPEIRVDAAKLSQIFVNLLTNAIHAMESRGTLTVRTYARQLTGIGSNIADSASASFRVGETIVVAEVEDNGPGIPEEKLGKIFEPFFTTKPTGKGTGLGLSVVKTIVDLHGGTVDLRNLPDRGVRATITLRA
jgi:PAS domain S-box-containing protein